MPSPMLKKVCVSLLAILCLLAAISVIVALFRPTRTPGQLPSTDLREIKSSVRKGNFEGLLHPGWSRAAPVFIQRGLSDLSFPITSVDAKANGVAEVWCGSIGYALQKEPNGWRIMKRMEKF